MCKVWSSGAPPSPFCPTSSSRRASSRHQPDRDRHGPLRGRGDRGRGDPAGRDHRTRPHALRCRPQAARKQPDRARTTSEQGAELSLRSGRTAFDLPCLPAADFPAMTDEGLDHSFALSVGDLIKLIDRTRFAISTEETRYYLNGIFLHCGRRGRGQLPAQRGHRRPSPGPGRGRPARGCRRHARRDRAAKDRRRAAQADRRARSRTPRSRWRCPTRASASRSARPCCAPA